MLNARRASTDGSPRATSARAPASDTAMPSAWRALTVSRNSRKVAATTRTGMADCSRTMFSAEVVWAAT